MKKLLFFNLLLIFILVFGACSNGRYVLNVGTIGNNDEKNGIVFSLGNELPSVTIAPADYNEFLEYLNFDGISCPYSDIFDLDTALNEKHAHNFDISTHANDFLGTSDKVDANRLCEIVIKNNEELLNGSKKFFYDKVSDSDLQKCCGIIADTVNWALENVEGLDKTEISCILGDLKILNANSMNFAVYNINDQIMAMTPSMIDSHKENTGISNIYDVVVCHETMHLVQSRCSDAKAGENDTFIGTSYSFENTSVNSLKNSWLYEASAELNATEIYGIEPTTYKYMIENFHTINFATILNDNNKADSLKKYSFTKDEDSLYRQLEFSDTKKAMEFIYAVEILRNAPEDFKKSYEAKYGTIDGGTEGYKEFIKLTYNPYFIEVTSKLFYKNLALKLSQQEIGLGDVFYLVSLYELDLMNAFPFDIADVRAKYPDVFRNYLDLQSAFFNMIQKNTDTDIKGEFESYSANYGDGAIYANASLDWLDTAKKDYILHRNINLYNEYHEAMITYES